MLVALVTLASIALIALIAWCKREHGWSF